MNKKKQSNLKKELIASIQKAMNKSVKINFKTSY
jgi:hypothetical protein